MKVRGIRNLILVRHGESTRNAVKGVFYQNTADREKVGVLQDWLVPLIPKGHRQAQLTGRILRKKFGVPDLLFHSGYRRTVETAAGILKAYVPAERSMMTVKENYLLRERDSGYLKNSTKDEVQETYPYWGDLWYTADRLITNPLGGENMALMSETRLTLFLSSLDGLAYRVGDGTTAFVVTHGRTIQGLRYLLEDWSQERMRYAIKHEIPDNCAVTHYSFNLLGIPHLEYANRVFQQP